jgi:hypothetical protein
MFKRLGIPIVVLGAALTALAPSQALAERSHEGRAAAPRHLRSHYRDHRADRFLTHDYWWRRDANGYHDAWGIWHPSRW